MPTPSRCLAARPGRFQQARRPLPGAASRKWLRRTFARDMGLNGDRAGRLRDGLWTADRRYDDCPVRGAALPSLLSAGQPGRRDRRTGAVDVTTELSHFVKVEPCTFPRPTKRVDQPTRSVR
jgi:hypothetical protein